ncbi:MAG TPA: hypothetical protein PKJ37_02400 [Acidobacteriota bacterium]|nr:hypothetical protein [Acidobacteriota bacterium]
MPIEIIVWDVQHGNAITFKTPEGNCIWCDAGAGSFDNGDEFSPYKHMKNPQIDLLVLSHPHDDHLADFWNMPMEKVTKCLHNHTISKTYQDTLAVTAEDPYIAATTLIKLFANDREFPCGLVASIAQPNERTLRMYAFWAKQDIGENLNNYSVVAFFCKGENVICIPGDIEETGWDHLRTAYAPAFEELLNKTTILVASHHGRQKGWYSELAELCNPDIVVISDSHEKETSITSSYDYISNGHEVKKRARNVREMLAPPIVAIKKCVSTRANGVIKISMRDNDFSVTVGKGI